MYQIQFAFNTLVQYKADTGLRGLSIHACVLDFQPVDMGSNPADYHYTNKMDKVLRFISDTTCIAYNEKFNAELLTSSIE